MASDQPLGELDVVIGVDWSDLQSGIDAAVTAAQAGADAISEAFTDSATFSAMVEGLETVTEGLDSVAAAAKATLDSLDSIGESASAAGDELAEIGSGAATADDALSALGDSASETEGALSTLGDSTSEASDALVEIGDGADEAESALSSLGDATDEADQSLSTLSDSVSEADDAIGSIDDTTAGAEDSLATLSDTAASTGDALVAVGSGADEATPSVEGVGEAAEETEGGLSAMVEQLTLLGEALAITEGLKEFGEEALTAYGTVQSVTIGLTALTGSATQADEVIEQIKQLAATEPFAFPEIAPTIQKMVAMGVSADQVGAAMQAVANSSAATGNQFSAVANMLDRMSLSGTANARSMATLGISTTDLGAAMGVTASQATAAFKALDQEDRITALDTALGKFAGDAVAQAQGISGQWQIFQNQFEEVMVGVGQAIAPVVGDILGFGKSVLSGIQEAEEAFQGLPAPVQDVIVVAGLLAAAVIPVTAGLAALGLGVIGLQGILPAVTGLMTALGVESTTAAAGIEAEGAAATTAAVETVAAATAIEGAEVAAGSMALAMNPLAAAILVTVAAATLMYGALQNDLKAMNDMAAATPATPAQAQEIQTLTTALTQYNQQAVIAGKQQIPIPNWNPATQTLQQYVDALQKASAGITSLGGSTGAAKAQLDAWNSGAGISVGALGSLSTGSVAATAALAKTAATINTLQTNLATAQAALALAKTQMDGTAQSADNLAAQAAAVQKAQQALNTELGNTPAAAKAAASGISGTHQSFLQAEEDADNFIAVWGNIQTSVDAAVADIKAKTATLSDNLDVAAGAFVAIGTDANASSADVVQAQTKIDAAVKATGDDYGALATALQAAMQAQGVSITSVITQFENLQTTGTGSAKDIQQAWQLVLTLGNAVGLSMGQIADAVNTVQAAVGGASVVIANGKLQLVGLASGADGATSSVNQLKGAAIPATEALQNFGVAAKNLPGWTGGAVIGTQQLSAAAAGAATAFGNAGDGLTYATSKAGATLATYAQQSGTAAQATGQAGAAASSAGTLVDTYTESLTSLNATQQDVDGTTQDVTIQVQGLEGTITDTTSASVAAAPQLTILAEGYQEAGIQAAAAAGQVDLFNDAVAQTSSGGKGGSGGQGANESAWASAEAGAAVMGFLDFVPALSGQTGGTSDPSGSSGGGGVDVNIDGGEQYEEQLGAAGATAFAALQTQLDTTTSSTNKLSYALTGGSLAPSLDTTTASAQQLEAQLNPVATLTAVAGVSLQQMLTLLNGGTIQLGGSAQTVAQELADANAEIATYNTQLGASTTAGTAATSTLSQLLTGLETTTTGTSDLSNAQNILGVTTSYLGDSTMSANETAADLTTSLNQIQGGLSAVNQSGGDYATQLATLDQAGHGAGDSAKILTGELNDENQASTDLQQAAQAVSIQLQNQTTATDLVNAALADSNTVWHEGTEIVNAAGQAIVSTTDDIGGSSGLTAAVTALGTAATKTASAASTAASSTSSGSVAGAVAQYESDYQAAGGDTALLQMTEGVASTMTAAAGTLQTDLQNIQAAAQAAAAAAPPENVTATIPGSGSNFYSATQSGGISATAAIMEAAQGSGLTDAELAQAISESATQQNEPGWTPQDAITEEEQSVAEQTAAAYEAANPEPGTAEIPGSGSNFYSTTQSGGLSGTAAVMEDASGMGLTNAELEDAVSLMQGPLVNAGMTPQMAITQAQQDAAEKVTEAYEAANPEPGTAEIPNSSYSGYDAATQMSNVQSAHQPTGTDTASQFASSIAANTAWLQAQGYTVAPYSSAPTEYSTPAPTNQAGGFTPSEAYATAPYPVAETPAEAQAAFLSTGGGTQSSYTPSQQSTGPTQLTLNVTVGGGLSQAQAQVTATQIVNALKNAGMKI